MHWLYLVSGGTVQVVNWDMLILVYFYAGEISIDLFISLHVGNKILTMIVTLRVSFSERSLQIQDFLPM